MSAVEPLNNQPLRVARFPLPAYARPMWGALDLFQRIERHHEWERPGPSLPVLEVRRWIWTLRACAGLLMTQSVRGARPSAHMLLQAWGELPLIWSPAMTEGWERDRPWAAPEWGLYQNQTPAYQALLEGETPSAAYQLEGVARQVWERWIDQTEVTVFIQLLEYSAQCWSDWLAQEPETAWVPPDEWVTLGQNMGLDAVQAAVWVTTELWWMEPTGAQKACLMQVLGELNFQGEEWMSVLAHVFLRPVDWMNQLFGPTSPLLPQVLEPREASSDAWAMRSARTWEDHMAQWNTRSWRWLRQRFWQVQSFSWDLLFASRVVPPHHEERSRRWAHLGPEFAQCVTALSQPKGASLLIVGAGGMGKSQFAWDLAAVCGRRVGQPDPKIMGNRTEKEGRGDNVTTALLWAGFALSDRDHGVMLLDGAGALGWESHPDDMLRYLQQFSVPLIATTHDLSTLRADVVRAFDKVVWLNELPVAQRMVLAQQFFTDDTLALKVARSLRSPYAIEGAARWCAAVNTWDWATVQSHRQNLERATTGKAYYEEPVDLGAGDGLPPHVGYGQLEEVADRLCRSFENPMAYAALGGKAPRGAILVGPPGTGKTLFARHLARRLSLSMLAPSTTRLQEKPEAVREMMNQARLQAPCVLLLDEAGELVWDDGKATSALLAEIDGAEPLEGVLIVATLNPTYRPISSAITRPGRLHEVHQIGLPEAADRTVIWQAYLEGKPTDEPTDAWWSVLSRASRGFSGADIAECLRRAGGDAVAQGAQVLTLRHLVTACDAIAWSAPTGKSGGAPEDMRKTALHEAGHALLAWRHGLEVQRITVRPRGGSLGAVAWAPPEDSRSLSRVQLHGQVQMTLGGACAEQVMFGHYASGVSGDLQAVRDTLALGITHYGFGAIGPVAAGRHELWSDQRRVALEEEVEYWAQWAFDEAAQWLESHRDWLEALGQQLLEERDLSGVDLDHWRDRVATSGDPLPEPPLQRAATHRIEGIGYREFRQHHRPASAEHTLHQSGSNGDPS